MHIGFSIGIYDCQDTEIETAIIDMMSDEGFDFVGRNAPRRNISRQDTLNYFKVDDKSMLHKSLIAPTKNKWCRIYPATGWFSEVQDFAIDLSGRLKCITITLLKDDSEGWGYEISQKGISLNKFHTSPWSETLQERTQLGVPQPEIKEEDYRENPALVADLFGVDKDRVATADMHSFFYLLNIEHGDAHYTFFSDYDLEPYQINIDNWYHLTFMRELTGSEIQWRQEWLAIFQADFPDTPAPVPPLWLFKT